MDYSGYKKTYSSVVVPERGLNASSNFDGYQSFYSPDGSMIPQKEGYGDKIAEFISECFFLDKKVDIHPPFPAGIRDEVYRFYMALLAYYESENPVLSKSTIVNLIRKEEEGIKWLKKTRFYSFTKSYNLTVQCLDPEDHEYFDSAYKIHDIGDFFNVRYWLNFKIDNPHDEDNFFLPLEYDKDVLKQYEERLFETLPDLIIDPILEEEILLDVTSSSSLGHGKNMPNWYYKQTDNHFTSEPLRGKGSFIQKNPGDTRYSITLSVPHSNTVKLIEKQCAQIAKEMRYSTYGMNPENFFKKYEKFKANNNFFYCRDIKKDGLTKNRRLVQSTINVLEKKYPGLPAWKYKGIFDNFYVDINGTTYNPPRGVGLGMSAAITTIIYNTLSFMVMDRVYAQENCISVFDAVIYHDDIAFGSNSEDGLEDLIDQDTILLKQLGLIISHNKCFHGTEFVLCENYSDEILNTKESYQRTTLKMIHASANITHAKYQFLSLCTLVDPMYYKVYVEEFVRHFGYEFYYDEVKYPSLFGGWIPAHYKNIDISMYTHTDIDKKQRACALISLYTVECYKHIAFKDVPYRPPIKQLYPYIENFGLTKAFHNDETEKSMYHKMMRLKLNKKTVYFWKKQFKLRQSKYLVLKDNFNMELREWYLQVRKTHPLTDFYPPQSLGTYRKIKDEDYAYNEYRPSNPKFQYLAFLNPGKLSDKIIPWPYPPEIKLGTYNPPTAEERHAVKELTHLFPNWSILFGELEFVNTPRIFIPGLEWYDQNQMLEVCYSITGEYKIPIVSDREQLDINFNWTFLEKLNKSRSSDLYLALATRLGYNHIKDIDITCNMDVVIETIRKINDRRLLAENFKKIEKEIFPDDISADRSDSQWGSMRSSFAWTNTPLNDDDFFTWQYSKKNYRDWRNAVFASIEGKITLLSIETGIIVHEIRPLTEVEKDALRLEPVERYLYLQSGGIVDEDNIPIVDRRLADDLSNDGSVDIFKDGDDSDGSQIGLFVGF